MTIAWIMFVEGEDYLWFFSDIMKSLIVKSGIQPFPNKVLSTNGIVIVVKFVWVHLKFKTSIAISKISGHLYNIEKIVYFCLLFYLMLTLLLFWDLHFSIILVFRDINSPFIKFLFHRFHSCFVILFNPFYKHFEIILGIC